MKDIRCLNSLSFFLLLVSSTLSAQGLSIFRQANTSKYYITIFNDTIKWAKAHSRCSDINATLVQLDDADVRKLVHELINSSSIHSFWIGATRTCKTCDDWVWSDGTAVNMSLINWKNTQPDNRDYEEDKLIILSEDLIFNDIRDSNKKATICQAIICNTPNVCDNGGLCTTDTTGILTCKCQPGFFGTTCSKRYCEAHTNPCKNSGSCSSTTTNPFFNCTCTPGTYNTTCADDYCNYFEPCKNDGTCSNITNAPFYRCDCADNGYYGATCEDDYCKTHSNTCKNNGVCSRKDTSPFFSCNCTKNGYSGDTCEDDYCVANPNKCQNGGTCSHKTTSPFFECACAMNGYYGETCEEDYCVTNPNKCKNGGTCSHKTTSPFFECACAINGYHGGTCEDDYCKTHPNTCKNGGVCSRKTTSPFFSCTCDMNGYYGETCEEDYCVTNPNKCQNGGTCSHKTTSPFFECACAINGYYGDTCEDDYCVTNPNTCKNNGVCSRRTTSPFFSCTCAKNGYYGKTCEDDYCVTNPNKCQNGGTCSHKTTFPFYECTCSGNGYYGDICEDDFCVTNPKTCRNGGTCSHETTAPFFECACATNGYYGDTCEDDYCVTNPNKCQNGGTCSHKITSPFFECACATNGYYGDTCGDDYCVVNPNKCQNGGTCSHKTTSPFFECACAANGYYGVTCEETYCSHHDNPCKNGGKCISSPQVRPYYKCNCTGTGYGGSACDGEELIQMISNANTIGIVGGYASIDIEIQSYDGLLTVVTYKGNTTKTEFQKRTNVGNGTTTFTFFINGTSEEGNYMIAAYPKSNTYTRNTTTRLTVHVNATVATVSPLFIFSPVTNGTSEVTCVGSGIPTPNVSWFYLTNKVAMVSNNVYQTMQTSKAILNVENAALNEDGIYTCIATNLVGNNNTRKITKEITQLAVYGSPKITNVDALPCSKKGILTVSWEPNNQTTSVLHKFVAESVNASSPQNFTAYQKFNEGAKVVFSDLDPYALYEITAEVCPDQCLGELNDSRKQITGHGLPDAVRNSNVEENADFCLAIWSKPNSPQDQVTDYEVSISETWKYQPPDLVSSVTTSTIVYVDSDIMNYTLKTKFNRIYSFNITARTCAGAGETVAANGTCTTKQSAPSVVPVATLSETLVAGPTREITVYLPYETNGPISCSFVIVHQGSNIAINGSFNGSFGIQQLKKAAVAALSNDTGVTYLSIAIPRINMIGGKLVTNLGDGNSTSCDISYIYTGKKLKKRSTDATSTTYSGKNKALLTGGTVYGFFIATTTPVENGEPLFQISQVQFFTNGQVIPQESYLLWIIIGGCAAVVLIVLIVGTILIYKRKSANKKDESNNGIQLSAMNGSSMSRNQQESKILYENLDIDTTGTDTDILLKMLLRQYSLLKANGSAKFSEQFQKIKETSKAFPLTTAVGKSEPTLKKNRYKNILPYDSTRVKLKEGTDGYINACYITGIKKKYIATQGPLRNTVKDFWQMIVEQKCQVIVMLTKCDEAGRRKCEKYWPDCNKTMQYGDINIENQGETFFGPYVKRTLKVSATKAGEHVIIHYQFLKWPDHGVPATTSGLFQLHKAVTESYSKIGQSAPLLVHCSAGVGRTGAFIGYDMLQTEMKNKSSVDFFNCVLFMRKQRVDMVQTCNQYELLHRLILERYLFGETDVTEEDIQHNPESRFMNNESLEKEFQNLSLADSLNDNSDKENHAHKNKVVILRQPEDTEWISIDAAFLEAYDKNTQLIAAQSPRNSTEEYFLRALLDNDVDIVVNLDESRSKTSTKDGGVQYWPVTTNRPLVVNNVTVNLQQQQSLQGFTKRNMVVSRNNNQEQKAVIQYHYTKWGSEESPNDTSEILDIISAIRNCTKARNSSTVLVHCSDGLGKSGIVCALINILDRIEQEKKMDVFRAIKDMRNLRSGMIQTLNQYKFCYEVGRSQLCPENVYENAAMLMDVEEPLYQNIG